MKLVPAFRLRPSTALAVALVSLSVTGCALPPKDPVAREAYREANDPLEGINRAVFGLNEATDIILLRPAAEIYRGVLPNPVRDVVRNFLRNLSTPLIIANNLLQGDFKGAETATQRLLVNTTAGLGGLFDIAALNGLEYEAEDFGQTLAVWGLPEGPYLVLPLFGPSNVRDAVGIAADTVADPVQIYIGNQDASEASVARAGVSGLDARSRVIEPIDELRATSFDYYAAVRSLYRQRRDAQIRDGETGETEFPEYPDFEDTPDGAVENTPSTSTSR